ncbi:hypothetical protein Tco_1216175 [Tanacetum coccineum]
MDVLPSNIIFDIFSRVSAKCLARSEVPTPILYHPHLCRQKITRSLSFHVTESKKVAGASDNYVLETKEGLFLEDDGKVVTSLDVVHPLTKECYELPTLSMCFDKTMLRDSCGLSFDASTNTLKMVCVLCKSNMVSDNPDMVKKDLCTMVHVSQLDVPTNDGGRPVICFDVEKEEFGLIDPPKRILSKSEAIQTPLCRHLAKADKNLDVLAILLFLRTEPHLSDILDMEDHHVFFRITCR